MKTSISQILIVFLFFLTANTQAQEWCSQVFCCYEEDCCIDEANYYAKILTGINFLENTTIKQNKSTYDTGYMIAGCLGYCWHNGIRAEAEYAFRKNTINKIHFFSDNSSTHGHLQTFSYMANLLWDLPLDWSVCSFRHIQPFIGAGIGYDSHRMHSCNCHFVFNQKKNDFSWQLMAGLVYPIWCNTEINLEYKFHQGGRFYNHTIGVGFTFKFGVWLWWND